jgi:hypothetical protein
VALIHRVIKRMAADAADRNAIYPVMSTTVGPTYTLGAVTLAAPTFTSPVIRRSVLVGADNLTLAENESGSIIHCGAAEDFVLPALTASNVGLEYEFLVTTTATSLTITAAAGDLLTGGVGMDSTTAGDSEAFSADGTDDLIITMNGTTTGGIIGSWVVLTAAGATQWLVRGNLLGSGTMVTPFS